MADDFEYDVFLSHSAKDKHVVRAVAERLRGDGLRVWLDEWEIRPGDSIPAKIEAGLEHSRVLVLCMSAHAFGSDPGAPGLESGTFRPMPITVCLLPPCWRPSRTAAPIRQKSPPTGVAKKPSWRPAANWIQTTSTIPSPES